MLTFKNAKLGNWLHYNHPEAQAVYAGKERVVIGHEQIQVGNDENGPIFADGEPIYGDGEDLFGVDWQEAWGEPPTEQTIENWEDPTPPLEPPAVTDVDRARQYAEAYAAAEQIIFLLMGRVAPALVVGGFFTPETVNAEGTRFMAFHRDLIIDFKNSGRHPDAGTALYNAIAATPSTTAFPWLLANEESILAIFGNGLPRNA